MKKSHVCTEVKTHLLDIVEKKAASLPHGKHLLSHIQTCPECRRLVKEFSIFWSQLKSSPEIEPSSDFFNGVIQKIKKHQDTKMLPKTIFTRLRPVFKAVPAAALIISGILIGNYLGDINSESKQVSVDEFMSEYFNRLDEVPSGSVADAYINLSPEEKKRQK